MGLLSDLWNAVFGKKSEPTPDATVFLLAGTGGKPSAVKPMMNGEVTKGRAIVEVVYPNRKKDIDNDIREGARILNDYLRGTAGRKIVFAHSLGAVVCSAWLRLYGPGSGIDPAELEFILIGSSIRPHGGFYPANNWTQKDGDPFVSAELVSPIADTRYPVRDYALQWDGWCDWPTDPSVKAAVDIAEWGQMFYHLMYERFPLERADYRRHVEGNITYIHIPIKVSMSDARRATIESGYQRPEAPR